MKYYTVKQIYPWLYSICGPVRVYCYLLVGEKSALLFDTGYGIAPLDEAIREVCDLPYEVVLGHGHGDHTNGAYQFKSAWIHPEDITLCKRQTSRTARRKIIADAAERLPHGFLTDFDEESYINSGAGNLQALQEGQIFDLGGLTARVVPMEGHTAGSIGLFIPEHRVLIDSDSANQHMWMFLDESLSVSDYISMLERTIRLDFDTFFYGHGDSPKEKSEFARYIEVARNIDTKKSEKYEGMPWLNGLLYQEDDGVGIIYRESRL